MVLVLDNLQLELLEISFWGFYLFILTKKRKKKKRNWKNLLHFSVVITCYFCQCSQRFHFFLFFPPWSGLCDMALALLPLAPWLFHLWNLSALCLSQFVANWRFLVPPLIAIWAKRHSIHLGFASGVSSGLSNQ